MIPPVSLLRAQDTHRLIPSKYMADGDSVLARIAGSDAHLADIFDLDNATNDRLLAENHLFPGIDTNELLFGVPWSRIVNAAFTHPHPFGSRFNGPERGAWYAALELATAQAEVIFHRTIDYAEIGRFDDSVTYDDFLADFSADFYDLRGSDEFALYLSPQSYVPSQGLALELFDRGALGIVYPSVRRLGGICLACFRPALVGNVRKSTTYRFTWSGLPEPKVEALSP